MHTLSDRELLSFPQKLYIDLDLVREKVYLNGPGNAAFIINFSVFGCVAQELIMA